MVEPTLPAYQQGGVPGAENYNPHYYYYYRPYTPTGNYYAAQSLPGGAPAPGPAPLAMQPPNSYSHYGRYTPAAPINHNGTSNVQIPSGPPANLSGDGAMGPQPGHPTLPMSSQAQMTYNAGMDPSNNDISGNNGKEAGLEISSGLPGPMDRERMMSWSASGNNNTQVPPFSMWPNGYASHVPQPPGMGYLPQQPPLPLAPYPRGYANGHQYQNPRHYHRGHYGYHGKVDMQNPRYMYPNPYYNHLRPMDKRKMDRSNAYGGHYNAVPNMPRAKLLETLGLQNINSDDFNEKPEKARFFVIKSYSDEDVHKSIKYGVWSSTAGGTKRLSNAYQACQEEDQPLYLFYSVNSSGQFCGVAQLQSDWYEENLTCWQHSKWQGHFKVKWLFIKDVPNDLLRHIKLNAIDARSVTTSRDTQEVVFEEGLKILSTFKAHKSSTSLLDDFTFYDKREMGREAARKRKEWKGEQTRKVTKDEKPQTANGVSSADDTESSASAEGEEDGADVKEPSNNGVAGSLTQTDCGTNGANGADDDRVKASLSHGVAKLEEPLPTTDDKADESHAADQTSNDDVAGCVDELAAEMDSLKLPETLPATA